MDQKDAEIITSIHALSGLSAGGQANNFSNACFLNEVQIDQGCPESQTAPLREGTSVYCISKHPCWVAKSVFDLIHFGI